MNRKNFLIKDKIKRIFFPKVCPLCGEIVPIEKRYCGCLGEEYNLVSKNFCRHCGAEKSGCSCGENGFSLPNITAPFYYSSLAKMRLLEFKFQKSKGESEFFGEKMAERFSVVFPSVKPDFVSFVPMTKEEREKRGFNQSGLLAFEVAKRLFVPCKGVLYKNKQSQAQHTLSQSERLKNLSGAFSVADKNAVKGKTIILCDDIKTTGTTLKRCCDVLFESGAKDIYCLCAAVTDYKTNF